MLYAKPAQIESSINDVSNIYYLRSLLLIDRNARVAQVSLSRDNFYNKK